MPSGLGRKCQGIQGSTGLGRKTLHVLLGKVPWRQSCLLPSVLGHVFGASQLVKLLAKPERVISFTRSLPELSRGNFDGSLPGEGTLYKPLHVLGLPRTRVLHHCCH